jgi:NADH:ubiquinone oxidoreductase subunit K
MALPITHYLYLALALFCVGLGGALLRRSLVVVLLGIQLMLGAIALLFAAYARFFVDPAGQIAALLVVLVGLIELAVAVAIVVRAVHAEQSEGERTELSLIHDWHHHHVPGGAAGPGDGDDDDGDEGGDDQGAAS